MEKWREIEGFEGYIVSDKGRVAVIRKGDPIWMRNGEKKRKARVDRLVAEAFLNNPHKHRKIVHKDGNARNNDVKNLRWSDEVVEKPEKDDIGLWERYIEYEVGPYYVDYARECIPEPDLRIEFYKTIR